MDREPVHGIFHPKFEDLLKENPKLSKHLNGPSAAPQDAKRKKDHMFEMMQDLTAFEWKRKLKKKERDTAEEIISRVFDPTTNALKESPSLIEAKGKSVEVEQVNQIEEEESPYSLKLFDPKSRLFFARLMLKKYFDVQKYPLPLGYLIPNVSGRFYSLILLKKLIEKKEAEQLQSGNSIISKTQVEALFFEREEKRVHKNGQKRRIIDLGVGANCIFPLLAAKAFDWKVLGFEKNEKSYKIAQEIITSNNLEKEITLECNATYERLIFDFFTKFRSGEEDHVHDALICNPPFYFNFKDFKKRKRKGFTGKPHEVICEGGEVRFAKSLITESEMLRKKIRWFSLYLSEKSSMFALKRKLDSLDSVSRVFHRIIPLGKKKRFFLAWTFKADAMIESKEKSQESQF